MAILNITWNGLSADCAVAFDAQVSDADIKRIAVEVLRSGGAPGLAVPELADSAFEQHVIDRLQNGERLYLRPKVPFG